jgi:DNA-binding GntR family transcriptional regulator
MALHLAVARASRVDLLAGFYESIVTLLASTMTRAVFVQDQGELLEHNLQVHANLIIAIRDQDTVALQKLLTLHHLDTIRVT